MKISMMLSYSGDPRMAAAEARDLESAGIDVGWVAELYSFDSVSILGYLAAQTQTMELGSAIFPIYSRTPTLTAMTAAGLDAVSGGRFILGLGASGPQVIEGWHGVPYDKPLGRQREIIEICRQVWKRERLVHDGPNYQLPLPEDQGTGLGKPLKLINHPVRNEIPIYLASLGPKNVELTAEIAEGWLPVFFHPGKSNDVWGDDLAAGLAKRDEATGPAPGRCRRGSGHHRRHRTGGQDPRWGPFHDGALCGWHGIQGEELLQQHLPQIRLRI